MALELSGSINISGSMTATTIVVSSPGVAGMVSSSAQIGELVPLMQSTSSINNLTGSLITTSSNNVIAIDGLNTYTASLNSKTGSYATTGSNSFIGNQTISGTLTATTSTTGATIKLGGFTNYGTIQDVNDVRRIWFENVGSYRTIFDLPASGSSFAFRTYDGTTLFNVNSGSGASVGTGDLTITNGNLVVASGKGIDFSATTNTAGTTSELLNDYEEGSWTPAWNSTGGTITTISAQTTGTYTKIGNVVHVWARLYTNSVSSPTGEVTVSGLPFTVGSQAGNKAMHLFTMNAITGTLTGTPTIAFNLNNTTATIFNKIWNSTEFGGDIATYFDNDTWGYFYGAYIV